MIRNFKLIIAFLFFSMQLQAQAEYVACTIIRENGIRTKGYVKDITPTKNKRLEAYDDLKSWEKIFNLDRKVLFIRVPKTVKLFLFLQIR